MLSTHTLRAGVLTSAAVAVIMASVAVPGASASGGGSGKATSYLVVMKAGGRSAGLKAIERAGGKVVDVNKLGIARVVSSKTAFASTLRSSGEVDAVGNDGGWQLQPLRVNAPSQVPGPEMAGDCAAQYGVPVGVGPDQLSACQWDMRIMNASPSDSYSVNRGDGAVIGILDTGVDYTHPDIAPNIDLGLSCSLITTGNPTADPVGDRPDRAGLRNEVGHTGSLRPRYPRGGYRGRSHQRNRCGRGGPGGHHCQP
jgi:lantibiotic leader peptide-processing serine protease